MFISIYHNPTVGKAEFLYRLGKTGMCKPWFVETKKNGEAGCAGEHK